MLRRLTIQRLAFLRAADLSWGPGLNILTGETGAGKSLLIESLGVLLGFKADLPPISEKALIEAEFSPVPAALQPHLEEPTDTLWLRCELLPSGRRRLFLNDSPTSASTLRSLAYYLVEIHSQHETQQLFQAPFQRELLDTYADLTAEAEAYRATYERWRALTDKVATLRSQEAQAAARLAWLTPQLEELEALRLSPEEYAALEKTIRRLEHQEQALALLSHWHHQLAEAPHAPLTVLREAEKSLGRLPLPELPSILSQLEQARLLLGEAASQIEALLNDFTLDPTEAQQARERYDACNSLLLKYRVPTLEALLDLREKLRSEYQALLNQQSQLEPAEKELQALTASLLEQGYRLELARLAAAQALADEVEKHLAQLGLSHARFHIAVERLKNPQSPYTWEGEGVELTPYGFSSVTFLLRTHPQLPLAPLSEVASGGELSRIMLALKAALAEKVQLPTLILDEIDTGLSGEGARRMGEFLRGLGQRLQIILITHLPAIAAQPGWHFRIWKEATPDGAWETRVQRLEPEERVQEVARLLSGQPPSQGALAAARELLASAERY